MGGVITDTIAEMLPRSRNANAARKDHVEVPASRLKREIARILKEEGFIADAHRVERGPQGVLRITLRYGPRREPVLTGIRRVSRPGLRIYSRRTAIPRARGGLGGAVLSPPARLM